MGGSTTALEPSPSSSPALPGPLCDLGKSLAPVNLDSPFCKVRTNSLSSQICSGQMDLRPCSSSSSENMGAFPLPSPEAAFLLGNRAGKTQQCLWKIKKVFSHTHAHYSVEAGQLVLSRLSAV